MLTTPDASDAVAICPPISPPGPNANGFFADCNPAAGFDGTRPIAEYFNELILNLHELLRRGHITPVKGDQDMLWRAIRGLLLIETNQTFNVATNGVANPADPWGGDPFDSLASVFAFLAPYRISPLAKVTVHVAAGTYTRTAALELNHSNGRQIYISGAGQATTLLKFTGLVPGVVLSSQLSLLADLTIQGDSAQTTTQPWLAPGLGLANGAAIVLNNLTVRDFAGYGVSIDASLLALAPAMTLTATGNKGAGISLTHAANVQATGATLSLSNNGGTTAPNLQVQTGILTADIINTVGGSQGLYAAGSGTVVGVRRLQCEAPSAAAGVMAIQGAQLIAGAGAVAGDWFTWNTAGGQPRNFLAQSYGYMETQAALSAANRANTSPAVNTVGNVQAYIQAT